MAEGQARIESMFAWICTDKTDGTEGVPAVGLPDGTIMPLYSARKDIAMRMLPTAQALAAEGHKMALVEFAYRITLDVIQPP